MSFMRKLGLWLALLLYTPLLLVLPTVLSLNATLNKPLYVKETFVKSGIYSALASYLEEQTLKSTELSASPLLLNTFKEVFTAGALQQVFEPTIDSTYTWLDNPDSAFDISINVKPLLDTFKSTSMERFQAQLATLPKCTGRQQPSSTNPYELNCIPPNVSLETIRKQAEEQLTANENLADQEVISLTNPKTEEAEPAQDENLADPEASQTEAPKFDVNQFKTISTVHKITKASAPYLIGLLVLMSAAILALATPWFKGLKRIGILLVVNGVLLFAGATVSSLLLGTLLPVPATEGTVGAAGREIANLLSQDIISTTRSFAIGYVVAGIIAIIAAVVLKKKLGDPKPSAASEVSKQDLLPSTKSKSESVKSESPDQKS